MSKVKQIIKQILQDQQHKIYEKELHAQKTDYDSWIRSQEKQLLVSDRIGIVSDHDDLKILLLSYEKFLACLSDIRDGKLSQELLFLSVNEGKLSDLAMPLLYQAYFGRNQEERKKNAEKIMDSENRPVLLYGDEDVLCNDRRANPWFKPDWSPDTFLSRFYFGSYVIIAVRPLRELLVRQPEWTESAWVEGQPEIQSKNRLYQLLYELIRENEGFTGWKRAGERIVHIPQILYHTKECGYDFVKEMHLEHTDLETSVGRDEKNVCVSVVIPSKDHPDILFRCLDSLLEKTVVSGRKDTSDGTGIELELIVVDNGSSQKNRQLVEQKLEQLKNEQNDQKIQINNCRYLYKELPFNFSKMCNWGAREAVGEYLLFLNDDMEIIQEDWLLLLLQKAQLSYVGAVGAKLLYPETDVIQHAGITNLRVGPAHKLQFAHDGEEHYFGRNRGVHDVLGVTGACLLVRKELFKQVGGFDEGLAVAFNDVDLCYKIYEAGYYNVVRNDVILFHHESLSRGKDGESKEKQQRLLREKDWLYLHHQELYGTDPFYHPYLTTDMLESEYTPAFRYQVDLSMEWAKVRECTAEVLRAREDACLVIGMECAMDIYKWKYGVTPENRKQPESEKPAECEQDFGYYFQGYSFVIGSDNACYKRELLLRRVDKEEQKERIYAVSLRKCYREDIREHLTDQLHVDLTGYEAKIKAGILPQGTYQFGMFAKDTCSKVKLVNWSSWTIEIEDRK